MRSSELTGVFRFWLLLRSYTLYLLSPPLLFTTIPPLRPPRPRPWHPILILIPPPITTSAPKRGPVLLFQYVYPSTRTSTRTPSFVLLFSYSIIFCILLSLVWFSCYADAPVSSFANWSKYVYLHFQNDRLRLVCAPLEAQARKCFESHAILNHKKRK
jgi:hypothetical protein